MNIFGFPLRDLHIFAVKLLVICESVKAVPSVLISIPPDSPCARMQHTKQSIFEWSVSKAMSFTCFKFLWHSSFSWWSRGSLSFWTVFLVGWYLPQTRNDRNTLNIALNNFQRWIWDNIREDCHSLDAHRQRGFYSFGCLLNWFRCRMLNRFF